jgi:hypothetical protein
LPIETINWRDGQQNPIIDESRRMGGDNNRVLLPVSTGNMSRQFMLRQTNKLVAMLAATFIVVVFIFAGRSCYNMNGSAQLEPEYRRRHAKKMRSELLEHFNSQHHYFPDCGRCLDNQFPNCQAACRRLGHADGQCGFHGSKDPMKCCSCTQSKPVATPAMWQSCPLELSDLVALKVNFDPESVGMPALPLEPRKVGVIIRTYSGER